MPRPDKLVLADNHGAETQRAMVSALKDNWRVDFRDDSELPWGELDGSGKMKVIFVNLVKLTLILGCLYLFICSLAILADGFRLVAGKRAGEVFRDSKFLGNPVSGLMVGVIAPSSFKAARHPRQSRLPWCLQNCCRRRKLFT